MIENGIRSTIDPQTYEQNKRLSREELLQKLAPVDFFTKEVWDSVSENGPLSEMLSERINTLRNNGLLDLAHRNKKKIVAKTRYFIHTSETPVYVGEPLDAYVRPQIMTYTKNDFKNGAPNE